MDKRKIIIGAVLLLIVFIGLFVYGSRQEFINQQGERGRAFTSQEYSFSINIPDGWSYRTTAEKVGNATLVIEFKSPDKKIAIPIFVEEKAWDVVKSEVRKNFKPETITEITLAGQPAVKIIAKEREINPGYTFRIKHPNMRDVVLLGTASFVGGDDLMTFWNSVENVLNSIEFK